MAVMLRVPTQRSERVPVPLITIAVAVVNVNEITITLVKRKGNTSQAP